MRGGVVPGFLDWREAVSQWRETGDISRMAEMAAVAVPEAQTLLLDSLLPGGLRNDIRSLIALEPREARRRL